MTSDIPAKIVGCVMTLATLALAVFNGQPFAILFDPVLYWLVRTLGQGWANSAVVFHGTSVLIAVVTIVVAVLPALLARRLLPARIGFAGQATIAGVCALGLTWPTLSLVFGDWQ